MSDVLANFDSIEEVVDGEETFTLKRKSRKLVITNDHATAPILYKFNESEEWGTLNGTESLSLYFTTRIVILSGAGIPFRVWSFG